MANLGATVGIMIKRFALAGLSAVLFLGSAAVGYGKGNQISVKDCYPTDRYNMAESYRPDAPERSVLGTGTVRYSGKVLAWPDCLPVRDALVEFWSWGPDGIYTSDYRATVTSDAQGNWEVFSSEMDPTKTPYHIHIKLTGPGIRPMTTAFYPETHNGGGVFDIIVLPANSAGPVGFLEQPVMTGEDPEEAKRRMEGNR
jgi:hypothetical protein